MIRLGSVAGIELTRVILKDLHFAFGEDVIISEKLMRRMLSDTSR